MPHARVARAFAPQRRPFARLAPEGAKVFNPSFDVTPHHLIAGIITERGIARAPYTASLAAIVGGAPVAV